MGEERRWRGKLNKEGREKFAIKVNELNLVERDILKEWKEVEKERSQENSGRDRKGGEVKR